MSLGGGEGVRISVSLSAWDCSCAVKAVMDGCRGADLYASKRESRRAAGAWEECGDEHRDVNGEISAEVHSSKLSEREVGCGDDPKEKFSLNILARFGTVEVKMRGWLRKSIRKERLVGLWIDSNDLCLKLMRVMVGVEVQYGV